MNTKKLIREQLDKKFIQLYELKDLQIPVTGWIYSIRQGLNMSLRQLGEKLSITPQSVREIELREKNGSVSLKVLRQVAGVLDMKFIYGFIPKNKTLENMIEKRAEELAVEIVKRTSLHMGLEDQTVSQDRIDEAITEKKDELKRRTAKALWD